MAYVITARETTGRAGSIDRGRSGAYTRVFIVESSDSRTGARRAIKAVADAYGLDIGTPYAIGTEPDPPGTPGDPWWEADPQSVVNTISADQASTDGLQWTVRVEYGPPDGVLPENPLSELPEEDWGSNCYERPVDQDRDGEAIVNSAGDPFDPAPMRDDSRIVLTLTRNEATANPALTRLYVDHVNDATWYGAAAGTVKLKSRTARSVPFSGLPAGKYYKVTYVFESNADGWKKRLLNAGYRQLVSGNLTPIYVGTQLATSPCLLSPAGALTSTPSFRAFDVYPEADFSALGFPGA